jgi:prolyl oligopeptidase PreP (S9A serine peptidase family)
MILIQTDAGHGGGKPTSKKIDEVVDVFSFFERTLGFKVVG